MNRRNFIHGTAGAAALSLSAGALDGIAKAFGATPRRALGGTGFEIFPVAYGGVVSMRDGQAASDRYVAWALEHGVNYFDVAPGYEDAQEKLGNSLGARRKDIFLACKTGHRQRAAAEADLEKSLALLHTDWFDVYQLHGLAKQSDLDQAFAADGVMSLMVKAKQDGKVRKLGFSAHSEEVALKAMALYDFDTVMFPLNWMMHRRSQMGAAVCREAQRRGMGILAIKPLIHRAWLSQEERQNSAYPKAWCKPLDTAADRDLAIAALKHPLKLGADVIIPPGDFKSFTFAVEHLDEFLNQPLTVTEQALLDGEFSNVKEHPFFT